MSSISFQIPEPGNWTVTGEFAGQIVTQQINITDKGSSNPVALSFSSSTITVTSPVGTSLLLTDGTNQLTAVSTGTNTFTIYNMGQWTVSGTLEGYTLNTVTVNVVAGQNYPVELSTQTATLTVTAPAGTVVTVTGGGDTQEITATSGTAVFQLTTLGSYQVSGTLNGLNSNTVTVDVTAYQPYTATLTIQAATIVVTTLDGVEVTAQNGGTTLTAVASDGQATFQTQTFGNWTISGTLSGYTFSPQTVDVQAYQQYDVSLQPLMATITVTAPNGTEITAENSTGEQVQGYADNGTAVLEIYSLDTWTVSGMQNGLVTNSVPVEVADWTNYPVTLTIWAATITVTTPTGTLVTAQNGATQIQGTASNNQVILAVQLTGNWVVSAQFDDQTDSETVNVQAEENYPIRLWVPTIVPTVATGSVVTCTQGETVLTKASQSGKVKFYVPTLGKWTLNATLNQQSSNTVIVDVQEDKDYPLLLNYTFATITVATVAGTEVTAQNGEIIITQAADSNGEAVFEVATFGTWTVSASFDGELVTADVVVSEAINYDVELKSTQKKIVYYTNATSLSTAKYLAGAASFPTIALIAGGAGPKGSYPNRQNRTVNAYDLSLTRTIATQLQEISQGVGGCTIGDYAVFAGGAANKPPNPAYLSDVFSVNLYTEQLTMTPGNDLPFGLGETRFVSTRDKKALYSTSRSPGGLAIFDNDLTVSVFTGTLSAFKECVAAECNEVAIFASQSTSEACVLTSDLTEIPVDSIGLARQNICPSRTENSALFAGGGTGTPTQTAIVDAYNKDFTHSLAPELSNPRFQMGGAYFNGNCVFCGGVGNGKTQSTIDSYDRYLTRSVVNGMAPSRFLPMCETVGPYLLVAGGGVGSSFDSTVNVFTLED